MPERMPLYRTRAELFGLVRIVVRVVGDVLVLFCVVDDHVHLLLVAERAGLRLGGLLRALRARVDVDAPRIRPVRDRRHLETLVCYVLTRPEHHGLRGKCTQWPGSCYQDLAGARLLDGYDPAALWEWLPRWQLRRVARLLGTSPPTPRSDLSGVSLTELWEAARFAYATDGRGRTPPAVDSRRVAARLGRSAGFEPAEIARTLGVERRTIWRLVRDAPPPAGSARPGSDFPPTAQ